jgi:hypothetical protein
MEASAISGSDRYSQVSSSGNTVQMADPLGQVPVGREYLPIHKSRPI